MNVSFDLSDVPYVSELELNIPMKILIDEERALVLLRGASAADRQRVEQRFWETYKGPAARGVATLLRFWSLVEVFSSRRFKALLLGRGYNLLGHAAGAAARLRLNAHWGFNPQRLLQAIQALHNETVETAAPQTANHPALRIVHNDGFEAVA